LEFDRFMQNVVLGVHLLICVALVGAVLMQRSEGGALGMGGGGGGGLISGRGAADLMVRITSWVGGVFFLTSIGLTVMANNREGPRSVLESVQTQPAPLTAPASLPARDPLLPARAGPAIDEQTDSAVAAPATSTPASAPSASTKTAPAPAAQKAPLGALRPTTPPPGAVKTTEPSNGVAPSTPTDGAPLGAISPAEPGESGQSSDQPSRPRVVGPDQ
jgi:preprotein translocase subunit SecG